MPLIEAGIRWQDPVRPQRGIFVNTLNDDLINEIMERNARRIVANSAEAERAPRERSDALQETLIRCLIESTEAVFATMCGWEMERGQCCSCEGFAPRHDISGIIGLTGPIKATVVVSVDRDLVFGAAESFLGERPTSIGSDVVDLVGELANMIGGNAKERLGMPNVVLGLPTVIAGSGHYVAYNSHMSIVMIPFECPQGALSIELGLA
jgi:chemotaxis protein CheX